MRIVVRDAAHSLPRGSKIECSPRLRLGMGFPEIRWLTYCQSGAGSAGNSLFENAVGPASLMVELVGLEPTTPCLQNTPGLSRTVAQLGLDLGCVCWDRP